MRYIQFITLPFLLLVLISTTSIKIFGQSCTVSSFSMDQPHEWPSHRNWVVSQFSSIGADAVVVNTLTLGTTAIYKKGYAVYTNHEGGSTTSDDQGNLMFYSNGRHLLKGVGSNADTIYSGLLSGDEMGGGSPNR